MVRQLLYKIKLQFSSFASLLKRSWLVRIILLSLVGLLIIFGSLLIVKSLSTNQPAADSACPATPNFKAVLPAGETIDQLGGWKSLCPPDGTISYVYQDTVDSTGLSVTLQPLPDGFTDDPDRQLKQLADDAHYTQQLRSSDGTTVYVGSSAKGPQSGMLIKHDLLIFIKTEAAIPNQAWQDYVSSLN